MYNTLERSRLRYKQRLSEAWAPAGSREPRLVGRLGRKTERCRCVRPLRRKVQPRNSERDVHRRTGLGGADDYLVTQQRLVGAVELARNGQNNVAASVVESVVGPAGGHGLARTIGRHLDET